MRKDSKIYIAGHNGMVGSSIFRLLLKNGYRNLIFRESSELNLINQHDVKEFFDKENPEYVFLAAARVGGILANSKYKADFLYENIMIQSNVIYQSYTHNVRKLLFLGSSCIYPKLSPQPIKEDYLLTGSLEPTNEAYAIAKISGIKMCQYYKSQYGCNFISAMPTNLYGPNDNYDLNDSHLIPALLRKFYEAKENGLREVYLWGDGTPRREFLHVDDCAEACVFLMKNYNDLQFLNLGFGIDHTIKDIADLISSKFSYDGEIIFDKSYPNGTPRKLLDVSQINKLGWRPSITLEAGIGMMINIIKDELSNYKRTN